MNQLTPQLEKLKLELENKEKRVKALERYEHEMMQSTEKYIKMAKINEELKGLVEQERSTYNDEKNKFEEELKNC